MTAILCCAADGVPFGLCAEEVAGFNRLRAEAPHLASLLRLRPTGELDDRAVTGSARRTLRLQAGERQALVNVDGPVHIRDVGPGQLRPLPRFLAMGADSTVIGFCADDQGGPLRVLVDVPAVVQLALAAATDERGDRSW